MTRPLLTVAAAAAGTAALGYSLYMSTQRFLLARPPYKVLAADGALQVRAYGPRVVAVTEVGTARHKPQNEAFRRLARYLFGGNSRSQKLSMTSPVEMERGERLERTSPVELEQAPDGALRMSFFMPPEYALDELPLPRDARVRLERAPARTVAALKFRGRVTDRRVDRKKQALLERARREGWATEGVPFLAQYDGPFALPFLRRTEVMVRLRPPERL